MPKAKARRRGKGKHNSAQGRASLPAQSGGALPAENGTRSSQIGRSPARATGSRGTQNLVMSAMIALGCWGIAISFIFFTSDPNRYLYSGMAALIAIMWSSIFGMRIRKLRQQK
jgi:hypothetical protein